MKSDVSLTKKLYFGKTPQIEICDVSPELAREWMDKNIGNRPKYPSNTKKIVSAIKAGKWRMTGDPIRFSSSGRLIDGQHRLMAIIEAGKTVPCVVMRDLGDDIFDVIDSGKPRGKVDVLSIEYGLPVQTSGMLSTASAYAIDYEKGQYHFSCKSEKSELIEFIDKNSGMIECAEYAQKLPSDAPVPRSIACVFYFYASKRNEDDAKRFIERFMVGAVNGADDNLLHLQKLCTAAKIARRKLSATEVLYRLIRIWNAEQKGAPIKYFSNTAMRKGDKFPEFI